MFLILKFGYNATKNNGTKKTPKCLISKLVIAIANMKLTETVSKKNNFKLVSINNILKDKNNKGRKKIKKIVFNEINKKYTEFNWKPDQMGIGNINKYIEPRNSLIGIG